MSRLLRVLIVDDVPGLRTLVRLVLEDDGRFDIVGEAADGLQAIELATTEKPDLVLLDLAMPVMDGLEALPRLVEGDKPPCVLVLSGFSEGKLANQCRALGASGYIEKGASPERIIAAIASVVDLEGPPAH